MTTDLLIHATLTVEGEPALLPAADARIKTLLVEEIFEGGFEEHHGATALSYDFKVRGGIPFPAFALASQEFPGLTVVAEWVNIAAGRKGRARIGEGRIVEHVEEPIATAAAMTGGRYLRAASDGTLHLAFALVRRGRDEWAGYLMNHERDALFALVRNGTAVELRVTEGAPEWAWQWSLDDAGDTLVAQACEPPQPLEREVYAELERLAHEFVAEWIWLRDAPAADTAIEVERYARLGYVVHDANVRASKLQRMQPPGDAAADASLVHSTLDADDAWIRDVLLRCWA